MSQSKATEEDSQGGNAYEVSISPARNRFIVILASLGLVASLVMGFLTEAPTLWGLLPILLYAVLALLGMDIVVATVVALLSGLLIMQISPLAASELLGDSLGETITIIGVIIMLGAGVGEILKETGVASTIVKGIMGVVGERSMLAVTFGVMIASGALVMALGTLAGAIAISAPIILPVAARLGFTRSATASMLFLGGCAGLAMAPFAGSNVAIMEAADVGYLQYVIYGGGPLALLSLVLGPFIVRWRQRRTNTKDDFYEAGEFEAEDVAIPATARRTSIVFAATLLLSVGYAVWVAAGTSFPLLALPVIGIATALSAGMSVAQTLTLMYRGATKLISIFILFWLLAGLFLMIDQLAPFDVILENYGTELADGSPFLFTILVALLGWVGVPGATAAQVILLDEVFGALGASIGVTAASWVVVMLFASKADTYGPFPNANMIGVMGLARSKNLQNMLITGWALLIPATLMYGLMLFFQTR